MNQAQSQTACLDVLVELTRAMGTIRGRVRLQKSMYLLQRLGLKELSGVEFFYHHYGPFSQSVVDDLEKGVEIGAIVEDAEALDDERQVYEYRLGPRAGEARELAAGSRALVEKISHYAFAEHWRTLELASTIDFLEQQKKISREVALRRALDLKPACRGYEADALRLLENVGLSAASAPAHPSC